MLKLANQLPRLTILIGLSLWLGSAQAAILTPGDSIDLEGTTSASEPDLAGMIMHDNLFTFSATNSEGDTLSGTYHDRVVRSDNTGELIFSGRIVEFTTTTATATAESQMTIVDWSVEGFSGYETNVEYRLDEAGDLGPESALRSPDDDGGNIIDFDFFPELEPDMSSRYSSIATDATLYDLTGIAYLGVDGFLDNDQIYLVELQGVAAPAPVPLPAAFWLFGTGLVGVLGFNRRRKG